MEEVEFLRDGTFLVTSTRIEVDGQTFAVRNVGSVKVSEPNTPYVAMLVLIACGIAGTSRGGVGYWAVFAGAAAWIWQAMTTQSLVLVTNGGEVVALKSRNRASVMVLRDAIAKAIASR